ncbi:32388_t:CDS:1, partial [Racocetra persica]
MVYQLNRRTDGLSIKKSTSSGHRYLDPNSKNLPVKIRNLVNQIPWGTILFDNI